MAEFPQSFVERVQPLQHIDIGDRGNDAVARLNESGLTVVAGLTRFYAGAISVMGYQSHIREYCPKDVSESRFATQETTATWLQKGKDGINGRAVFLLVRDDSALPPNSVDEPRGLLEGYGWTGYEPCAQLPQAPITSAYRIGERAQGKGYGKDFVQAIVSATHTLHAPGMGIGLETWKSNHAAGMYQKVGFVLQPKAPGQKREPRPTLNKRAKNGKVLDLRLYMAYDNELLG